MTRTWFVQNGATDPIGPVSTDLIIKGIVAGKIPLTSRVAEVGSNQYVPLATVESFARIIAEAFPPPTAPVVKVTGTAPIVEASPPADVNPAGRATNTVQVDNGPTVSTATDKPFAYASDTSNTKYNPRIIEEAAQGLYQRAATIVVLSAVRYLVGFGIFGFVAGFAIARFEVSGAVVGAFVCAAIGAFVGAAAGETHAFQYRLQAQQVLCQLQIEINTRR
jgi:hypothetical protein